MNDNNTIHSFWIGKKLTRIGVLSINSFTYFKHNYFLWTYDSIKNVPSGIIVRNAEELVPKEIYENWFGKNSLKPKDPKKKKIHQAFADYFRLKILQKYGGYWCDLDIVALKKFDFNQEYVFSWGNWPCVWMNQNLKERLGIPKALNNGTIKCPSNCTLVKEMLKECEDKALRAELPNWAEWNHPLSKLVCDLSLQKYIPKYPIFEPYGENEWDIPFINNIEPPNWAYSLHLYNSQGLKKIKKNSLVHNLIKKYSCSVFL